MLTVLNDPLQATGGELFELDCSLTIQENIQLRLQAGADYMLWINGDKIDAPELCDTLDRLARPDDMIRLARRQEGIETLIFAAIAAVAAVAVVALTPKPQIPNNAGASKDSPNNKFTGSTNLFRLYQAIPDVYGTCVCYPDLIQQSFYEYINNVKYITELMLISRGTGNVDKVKSATSPFSDISGASFEVFKPTYSADQYPEDGTTLVTSIIESFATPNVDGQTLKPAVIPPTITGNAPAYFSSGTLTINVTADFSDLTSVIGVSLGVYLDLTYQYATPDGVVTEVFRDEVTLVSFNSTQIIMSGVGLVSTFLQGSSYRFSVRRVAPDTYTSTSFTIPTPAPSIQYNFAMLRGLRGDDGGATVTVRVNYVGVNDDGSEIAGSAGSENFSFSGDTFEQQFRTTYVTPAYGYARYKTNITRTNVTASPKADYDQIKIESINGIRNYGAKQFPSSTIIRVRTRATEQATSGNERKFNVEFTRAVRDFDTASCTPSRSMARAIIHQHVAVAKRSIDQLDLDSLRAINASLPANTTLLNFDFTFDDKDVSYGERIATIANAGRCSVFRDGSRWSFVRDAVRGSYPEMQLDYRNLASGGSSTISMDRITPNSHDGVELEYVDPLLNKKALIKLRINTNGSIVNGTCSNPLKVRLAGCRDIVQATNRARLEAGHLVYSRDAVSDDALSDANMLGRGALVRWIDPNDFYGDDGLQAGEIISINGNVVETSEECFFKGQLVGRVAFTAKDGASSLFVRCTPRTDGVFGFVVDSMPSAVYLKSGAQGASSRYAFGVGLTEAEISEAGLYTVVTKTPKPDGTVSLQLRKYDKRAYAFD